MPSLFDMVTAHLDDTALQQLSGRLGALAQNAQQGTGAQQLNDALARDHDGSVLHDVSGTIRDQPVANGDAIRW